MAEKQVIKVTVTSEKKVRLPSLPNFILPEDGDSIPIENFTRDQLREIGTLWTDALIRKADGRRGDRMRAINKKPDNWKQQEGFGMDESPYTKEEIEDLIEQINTLRKALSLCWGMLPDGEYGPDAIAIKQCMTRFNCWPSLGENDEATARSTFAADRHDLLRPCAQGRQNMGGNKTDVTGEACSAVAKRALEFGNGRLIVTRNGAPAYEITVREIGQQSEQQ